MIKRIKMSFLFIFMLKLGLTSRDAWAQPYTDFCLYIVYIYYLVSHIYSSYVLFTHAHFSQAQISIIFLLPTRCKCNEIMAMPTTTESICCKEIAKIDAKSKEQKVECIISITITQHPGVSTICIDLQCLEIFYTYMQQYDSLPSNQ